jgi:hypothetical protein
MISKTRATALILLVLLLLAAAVWFTTGGGQGTPATTAQAPRQPPASAGNATATRPLTKEQRAEQLSEATFMNASEVEPLGVERLAAYLPQRLAGLARSGGGGGRNEETGFPITTASATYAGADGRSLELRISDLAGPKGIAAYAAWALLGDQDNSGDEGYERARIVGARRYYEQWDRTAARGEQAVLLGSRFVVSVSGNPEDAATLTAALNEVDLNGVEGLGRP